MGKVRNFGSASKDLRQTSKNWGKRKVVGVIRDGKYVDPETGEEISLKDRPVKEFSAIYISKMGGLE